MGDFDLGEMVKKKNNKTFVWIGTVGIKKNVFFNLEISDIQILFKKVHSSSVGFSVLVFQAEVQKKHYFFPQTFLLRHKTGFWGRF